MSLKDIKINLNAGFDSQHPVYTGLKKVGLTVEIINNKMLHQFSVQWQWIDEEKIKKNNQEAFQLAEQVACIWLDGQQLVQVVKQENLTDYIHSQNIRTVLILQGVQEYIDLLEQGPNKSAREIDKQRYEEWTFNLALSDNWIDFKQVQDFQDTVEYLLRVTKVLVQSLSWPINEYFSRGTIHSEKSAAFQENECKLLWIDMLMAIPGISEDKALAIVEKYPTLTHLYEEYENKELIEKQKKELLADIQVGITGRKLGKALSRRIFHYYNSLNPEEVIN